MVVRDRAINSLDFLNDNDIKANWMDENNDGPKATIQRSDTDRRNSFLLRTMLFIFLSERSL